MNRLIFPFFFGTIKVRGRLIFIRLISKGTSPRSSGSEAITYMYPLPARHNTYLTTDVAQLVLLLVQSRLIITYATLVRHAVWTRSNNEHDLSGHATWRTLASSNIRATKQRARRRKVDVR